MPITPVNDDPIVLPPVKVTATRIREGAQTRWVWADTFREYELTWNNATQAFDILEIVSGGYLVEEEVPDLPTPSVPTPPVVVVNVTSTPPTMLNGIEARTYTYVYSDGSSEVFNIWRGSDNNVYWWNGTNWRVATTIDGPWTDTNQGPVAHEAPSSGWQQN